MEAATSINVPEMGYVVTACARCRLNVRLVEDAEASLAAGISGLIYGLFFDFGPAWFRFGF